MFDKMNTAQKRLMAIVAVLIVVFQLYKFIDEGIEGSGWILAFLVAALLLLPILSNFPVKKVTEEVQTTPPVPQEVLDVHRLQTQNRDAMEGIRIRTEEMQRNFAHWTLSQKFFNNDVGTLYGEASVIVSFAIAVIAEWRKDHSFVNSKRCGLLSMQTAHYHAQSRIAVIKGINPEHKVDIKTIETDAQKKLFCTIPIIEKYIAATQANDSVPEKPILDWLFSISELRFANKEPLQTQISTKLVAYIKNALQEVPSKA